MTLTLPKHPAIPKFCERCGEEYQTDMRCWNCNHCASQHIRGIGCGAEWCSCKNYVDGWIEYWCETPNCHHPDLELAYRVKETK
jgi:hypothetical protein